MLSIQETGILILLKNALKGEKQTPPEGFDWNLAYEFAKKHQIIPLVYYGGAHLEGFAESKIGMRFLMTTMGLAAFSENQLREIDVLTNAFEENQIEYMKLKGTVLKRLYPQPEMRLMSDSDILIKEEQMPEIKGIMQRLGYEYQKSSDHEWIWAKPELTAELHKRIVASYQKDYYDYFGNGWRLAKAVEGSFEYKMSKEDELIYLFTHLAKHYRDAGIGIKHFVDIYVFLNSEKELDMEYVKSTLKKLELYTFFENVKRMLNVWFCDTGWDEVSEFITLKVFESGVYGQRLTEIKSEALKNKKAGKSNSRLARLFSHIFPPLSSMKNMFPVLSKAPILLPFMWVGRWFRLIFKGKKSIQKYKNESKININDEVINEYQCELNYVGLDYNF